MRHQVNTLGTVLSGTPVKAAALGNICKPVDEITSESTMNRIIKDEIFPFFNIVMNPSTSR